MKSQISLLGAAAAALTLVTPAHATWFKHVHYCQCGHSQGNKLCGSPSAGTTTTSGGTSTTTSGGATSTTSSGGQSGTTSGATAVPEPGMLGLMGLSVLGLGWLRRRRR